MEIPVAYDENVAGTARPEVGQDDLFKEHRIERIRQQKGFMERAFTAKEPGVHAPTPSVNTRNARVSTSWPSGVAPLESMSLSCFIQPNASRRRDAVRPAL